MTTVDEAGTTRLVRVEASSDGTATIMLDHPPANAVTPEMIDELLEAIDAVGSDPEVRSVVVAGGSERFCAGADVAVMQDFSRSTYRSMRRWIEAQDAFERLEKPVVCAIERYALGGGAELSLACDIRVIGRSARYGFPEATLGLFPGAGGTQRLTRLVGTSRAFWLMASGEVLSADRACELGLVNEVVDDGQAISRARELAARLATGPTRAIGLMKRLVYESWGRPLPAGIEKEQEAVFEVIETADVREGFAAFVEKRPPHFTGA